MGHDGLVAYERRAGIEGESFGRVSYLIKPLLTRSELAQLGGNRSSVVARAGCEIDLLLSS
jgi:hypothetical protein